MPHFPKPFFRPKKNRWYVQLDGKHINLGADKEGAFKRYHELMASRDTKPIVPGNTVAEILDQFLGWCEKNRSQRTYLAYKERLQSFVDHMASPLTVERLRVYHVQEWVDSHDSWNPGMKRGRMGAVQRALNWAVKQGLIEKSPIAHMEKPPQGRRDNVVEPDVFEQMLLLVPNEEFRDLITVAWECGPRPQEIITVERRHVDVDGARWVFPANEAKGKKRIRIVYLTPTALAISVKLKERTAEGPIFRNCKGRPWTPWAINCAFCRLNEKLGHKYALYDLRHSWMTRLLKTGVDPITISVLAGHVDTSMLSRTYAHVNSDDEHLRKALHKGVTPEDA